MILAATNWANAGLIALVSICLVFTVLVLLIFNLKTRPLTKGNKYETHHHP